MRRRPCVPKALDDGSVPHNGEGRIDVLGRHPLGPTAQNSDSELLTRTLMVCCGEPTMNSVVDQLPSLPSLAIPRQHELAQQYREMRRKVYMG